MDELTPLTKGGSDNFGGLGATLIDSLDTLHMMGLYTDFRRYTFQHRLVSCIFCEKGSSLILQDTCPQFVQDATNKQCQIGLCMQGERLGGKPVGLAT